MVKIDQTGRRPCASLEGLEYREAMPSVLARLARELRFPTRGSFLFTSCKTLGSCGTLLRTVVARMAKVDVSPWEQAGHGKQHQSGCI